MLWVVEAPPRKGMEKSSSASEHREFVSIAVAEMVTKNVITILSLGKKPWVVSP